MELAGRLVVQLIVAVDELGLACKFVTDSACKLETATLCWHHRAPVQMHRLSIAFFRANLLVVGP